MLRKIKRGLLLLLSCSAVAILNLPRRFQQINFQNGLIGDTRGRGVSLVLSIQDSLSHETDVYHFSSGILITELIVNLSIHDYYYTALMCTLQDLRKINATNNASLLETENKHLTTLIDFLFQAEKTRQRIMASVRQTDLSTELRSG